MKVCNVQNPMSTNSLTAERFPTLLYVINQLAQRNSFIPESWDIMSWVGSIFGLYQVQTIALKNKTAFFAATHSKHSSNGTVWYKANPS